MNAVCAANRRHFSVVPAAGYGEADGWSVFVRLRLNYLIFSRVT